MAQAAVTAMASTDPPESGAVVPFARPVRRMKEYRRLSWPKDLAELLRLHQEGLTQVAVAERLGCRQCTVSRWLARLDDTRALAKAYLRSQALRMAHNIVENGTVADHSRVLQLLGVLRQNTGDGRLLVFIPGEAEPIWQEPARALPGTAEALDGNARAATSS